MTLANVETKVELFRERAYIQQVENLATLLETINLYLEVFTCYRMQVLKVFR